MIDRMYKAMDTACETASKLIGVSIKFPRPGKQALRINSFTSGVAGIGLTVFGIFTTHKWTIVLGILSFASSLLTRAQANKS